jgi:hypothetical protein
MLMFGKVLGFCALLRFVRRWAWQTATRSGLIVFEKSRERKDMDGQAFYVIVIISFFLGRLVSAFVVRAVSALYHRHRSPDDGRWH